MADQLIPYSDSSTFGQRLPASVRSELELRNVPAYALNGAYAPTKRYDRERGLYNAGATLTRSRTKLALAAAGLGHFHIVGMGDSIMAGQGANRATTSLPAALKAILASIAPIAGSGILITGNNPSDPRVTVSGSGWARPSDLLHSYTSTVGSAVTFAHTDPGTIVRIYYARNSGAFTYSIDGAAPVTVTPDNASGEMIFLEVTGLTLAPHTVVCTATTTTALQIIGCECRKATGVSVSNLGSAGTTTGAWGANTLPGSFAFNARRTAPDLVIINLGMNDGIQATAAATTRDNLVALIAYLRAVVPTVDIILNTPTPTGAVADMTAWNQAVWKVADLADVAVVDLATLMGSYAILNAAGVMSDNVHPNAAGYKQMALFIAQVFGTAGNAPRPVATKSVTDTLTVTASPMIYQAGEFEENLYFIGGTWTTVKLNGVTMATTNPSMLACQPYDIVEMTYTAAPTAVKRQKIV